MGQVLLFAVVTSSALVIGSLVGVRVTLPKRTHLPEALVGSASMREQGRSTGAVLTLWVICGALLVLAVLLGAGPLSSTDPEVISLPLAFAAGAVLASLANTLVPEAYEHGGPAVALSTAAGFALSYVPSLM